jgi:hypothetical protein
MSHNLKKIQLSEKVFPKPRQTAAAGAFREVSEATYQTRIRPKSLPTKARHKAIDNSYSS